MAMQQMPLHLDDQRVANLRQRNTGKPAMGRTSSCQRKDLDQCQIPVWFALQKNFMCEVC